MRLGIACLLAFLGAVAAVRVATASPAPGPASVVAAQLVLE